MNWDSREIRLGHGSRPPGARLRRPRWRRLDAGPCPRRPLVSLWESPPQGALVDEVLRRPRHLSTYPSGRADRRGTRPRTASSGFPVCGPTSKSPSCTTAARPGPDRLLQEVEPLVAEGAHHPDQPDLGRLRRRSPRHCQVVMLEMVEDRVVVPHHIRKTQLCRRQSRPPASETER